MIKNSINELLISYCGLRYIFDLDINEDGVYKIIIKNMSKHNKPFVEVMYSSLKTKVISKNDIEKPKRIINDTKKLLDNFSHHFKLKSGANKERYKSKSYYIYDYICYICLYMYKFINIEVQYSNKQFFIVCVIETVIMIFISVVQFYFIKKYLIRVMTKRD